MRITGLLICSLATAILALPAVAEVYRKVDENGNVTFTDEPTEGAERIQVKPVTTITMPKPETVIRLIEEDEEIGDQSSYESATFISPANEEAFYSGSGDITLRVTSDPDLHEGHRFEVSLDGQPVGQNRSGEVTVENVFRGTHNASVYIINEEGERIYTGQQIEFTVHRPSVLN